MTPQEAYQKLLEHSRDTAVWGSIMGLLGWDQRVMMPARGVKHRAEQMARLSLHLHKLRTDPRIGEWLDVAEQGDFARDPFSVEAVNLFWWRRAYERTRKIPERWVQERARVSSLAEKEWEVARSEADFSRFAPYLEDQVRLSRELVDILGYDEEPYDALLDLFEPGTTSRQVDALFAPLTTWIPEMVERIRARGRKVEDILHGHFPRDRQETFVREVLVKWGFDFSMVRLDPTVHPFAIHIGPGDYRITTRYYEDFLSPALFGTLHEAGHAMYEMGLPEAHWGTPRGDAVSHAVHESQSRTWENVVGRSEGFWRYFYPRLQDLFGELKGTPLEAFLLAINEVKPSLIRVEADEVTYNLHIFLRFELERRLIRGDLAVKDLPDAWNETFARLFGFRPENDRDGVLQDVHWSGGSFGYFPTYAMGNLYAAQFMEAARRDLGDLDELFARGEFQVLRAWLQEKIYQVGSTYLPAKLVEVVTGSAPSPEPWMRYIERKYVRLYGL